MKARLASALAALIFLSLLFPSATVFSQSGLRQVPLGYCAMSSMSSATAITSTSCVLASFTGSIAGSTLTVSAVASGAILPGQQLFGTGIPTGTVVSANGTGTGGTGTYTLNIPLTVTSESITTAGVPPQASYAVFCAYVQGVVWLDNGATPTGTAGTGGEGLSAGACLPYNATFTAFQAIQQAGGAILGISFYR